VYKLNTILTVVKKGVKNDGKQNPAKQRMVEAKRATPFTFR
jgi:hypothetical protein